MTPKEVYDLMLFIHRKNQSKSFAEEECNAYVNAASDSYLVYCLGEFEQYQYGKPAARVQLGNNAVIRDRISPFISPLTPITASAATGIAELPTDYLAFDAMFWGSSMKKVRCVEPDRLDSHINSDIDPIESNPVFIFIKNNFQFFPKTITGVTLSYVQRPIRFSYNFNTVDDRREYDAGNSKALPWRNTEMMEVIARALAMSGVSLQARDVQQYAQTIKTQGA